MGNPDTYRILYEIGKEVAVKGTKLGGYDFMARDIWFHNLLGNIVAILTIEGEDLIIKPPYISLDHYTTRICLGDPNLIAQTQKVLTLLATVRNNK